MCLAIIFFYFLQILTKCKFAIQILVQNKNCKVYEVQLVIQTFVFKLDKFARNMFFVTMFYQVLSSCFKLDSPCAKKMRHKIKIRIFKLYFGHGSRKTGRNPAFTSLLTIKTPLLLVYFPSQYFSHLSLNPYDLFLCVSSNLQ